MISTLVRPWVRPAIAALAALMAMGWCAPARIMASCGDYVTTGHGASMPREPLPMFEVTSQSPDGEALPQMLGRAFLAHDLTRPAPCRQCPMAPSDAPCQGPWCSGSPLPMPVPPTTLEHVQDQWACWGSSGNRDTGEQIGLHILQDHQDRVHHVFLIFHPPRPI